MTIRLHAELYDDLEAAARVTGDSASHLVRAAVARLIDEARSDPEFQLSAQRLAEAERSRLERFRTPGAKSRKVS